jgi:hypothetical protein
MFRGSAPNSCPTTDVSSAQNSGTAMTLARKRVVA